MPDRVRSPATIRDIADLAGVSRMTVSRAINSPHRVSADTLARVEAAIAETGYRPDPAARQLARGGVVASAVSEARVVLAYPEAEESRLGAYLAACIAAARQAGMQLVPLAVGEGRGERETMRLDRLDPQALILLRGVGGALAHHGDLPACAIGGEPEGVAAVCIDEAAAAYDLTQRLIFLGHKRIGFVGEEGAHLDGYARALAAFGLPAAPELVVDTVRSASEAALMLLTRIDPPSAIITLRADQAVSCLAAASMRGRGADEIMVCYFDDYGIDAPWPALARASMPVAEMCRAAFRLLAERIECARAGRPAPPIRRILFPRAISGTLLPVRGQNASLRRARL